MRSARQLESTVSEWKEQQRAATARAGRQFAAMTAAARRAHEPWIEWIDAGCPEVTREQYQASLPPRAGGRPASQQEALR